MIYRRLTRADNSQITQDQIKSFHYHVQTNQNENLRLGNVIPSFIEVELYIDSGNLPDIGETIRYSRGYDVDGNFDPVTPTQWYVVGYFKVYEKHISNDNVCSIIAYDRLKELDINYSNRLLELKANGSFPMSAYDLLNDAITYAGLSNAVYPLFTNLMVTSFYADTITCRDIVSAFCELSSFYIKDTGNVNKDISEGGYGDVSATPFNWNYKYIVCPTDQITYYDDNNNPLIPVYYKQDGLSVSEFDVQTVDEVFIYNSEGILLGRTFQSNNPSNIYYITDNLIANNAVLDDPITMNGVDMFLKWETIARATYTTINGMLPYRPLSVDLFPFRYPFPKTTNISVEDKSANRYAIPITSIDETDSVITVSAFGQTETQEVTSQFDTADQKSTSLDVRLNNLSKNVEQNTSDILDVLNDISDAYDDTATYAVNDLCIYNNVLYRCTTAVTAAEAFDPSKWTATTLADEKVSKTGDTMSGALIVQRPSGTTEFVLQCTDDDKTVNTSTINASSLSFRDKNNLAYFNIRSRHNSAGYYGMWIYALNSSNETNSLQILIKEDGSKSVIISDPDKWLDALGIGTSGVLPVTIAQGGTGETTDVNALQALQGRPWKTTSIASNGTASRTITFTDSCRGMLYLNGTNANRTGIYMFYGSATTVYLTPIVTAGANLTLTTNANTLTIANASTSACYIAVEFFDKAYYNRCTIS